MAPILSVKKKRALAVLLVLQMKAHKRGDSHTRKQRRSVWTKAWLLLREEQGAYHNLIQELRLQDIDSYRNFLRMDVTAFEELLGK